MNDRTPPLLDRVREYWQEHPLFSYELSQPGSPEFFDQLDELKRNDIERFTQAYWRFDQFHGKNVLDVGCGPGWLTVKYAEAGANVSSIDLTPRAVELARRFLVLRGLSAVVKEANAEDLPFDDGAFDLVVSSGVIHHTADIPAALRECRRVLKPGGLAKVTFYCKGILHHPVFFPFTRLAMRLSGVKHPGSDLARTSNGVDDFIRRYDGEWNPVGVGHTVAGWRNLLLAAGFKIRGHEIHFFPRRFVPYGHVIPRSAHLLLDRVFGTMVYFDLEKP
jgi:SAM-dependent methyltransferase